MLYKKYESLYWSLRKIIIESEERVRGKNEDILFVDNVNFFVKSYLINICTYLEAYLQDACFECIKNINARLVNANVPHNFLYWQISREIKDKELKFSYANFTISKKNVAEDISGNPYKTIKTFRLIGVDLEKEAGFQKYKEIVNSVVVKRNNIVHHNDNAIDVSFSDLLSYIDSFLAYMESIDKAVCGS